MAKMISSADGAILRDMPNGQREAFMLAFAEWWSGLQIRDRALRLARQQQGGTYTAQDLADTKAALMVHFQAQPDPTSFGG